MTSVDLSAEERAEMRAASEGTIRTLATVGVPAPHHERVLALLDALDTAEARAATMEAEWDDEANVRTWDVAEAKIAALKARAEAAEAEVASLTAERDMQRESARFHAERAGRLAALVEAVQALADEWERHHNNVTRAFGIVLRSKIGGAS